MDSISPVVQRRIQRDRRTAGAHDIDRFVATFVRPHGISQPATPIFAETIVRLAAAPAPAPEQPPAWRHVVRPLLLAAVTPVVIVDWFGDRSKFVKLRKSAGSLARRGRKRVTRARARWKRYFEEAW